MYFDEERFYKTINTKDAEEFINSLSILSEEDILAKLPEIHEYLHFQRSWNVIKEYVEKIFNYIDKHKAMEELLRNEKKFKSWSEILDFPEKLKYGVEIEVADLNIDEIQAIFDDSLVHDIFETIGVPKDIANQIIQHAVFNKKNEPDKWIFSKECGSDESEASSPIMHNNLKDLNQISAVCLLFQVLGAKLHGGTGLHINVGVDYFECNEKAIEYLLKIWGECEELFFKVANPEGEVIRVQAHDMATPIKENIQDFFVDDGSVMLNTEEDFEKFLYQIQARNRMYQVMAWVDYEVGDEYDLEEDYSNAKTDEQRFEVYRRYHRVAREKDISCKVRWTSINFNHMRWNEEEPGRIEFRIFNSSLEPKIIFENLILVGKICKTSLELAKNPEYKKEVFEQLCRHDISETKKINAMLDLLFNKSDQKKIFKNRWKSIRKEEEYNSLRSGKDTFVR